MLLFYEYKVWARSEIIKFFFDPATTERLTAARIFLFKMERSIFLCIVALIVLTSFAQGSPINDENDSNVMRRGSLLEKLGMELQR